MSFGFPAYFTESRMFHLGQVALVEAVKATFNSLGWRHQVLSDNELQARVSMTLWSWGEKLNVEVSENGEMKVKSKCAYPLQCIDWGKNEINVQTFFTRLDEVKESRSIVEASEKVPTAFDKRGFSPVERMFGDDKVE